MAKDNAWGRDSQDAESRMDLWDAIEATALELLNPELEKKRTELKNALLQRVAEVLTGYGIITPLSPGRTRDEIDAVSDMQIHDLLVAIQNRITYNLKPTTPRITAEFLNYPLDYLLGFPEDRTWVDELAALGYSKMGDVLTNYKSGKQKRLTAPIDNINIDLISRFGEEKGPKFLSKLCEGLTKRGLHDLAEREGKKLNAKEEKTLSEFEPSPKLLRLFSTSLQDLEIEPIGFKGRILSAFKAQSQARGIRTRGFDMIADILEVDLKDGTLKIARNITLGRFPNLQEKSLAAMHGALISLGVPLGKKLSESEIQLLKHVKKTSPPDEMNPKETDGVPWQYREHPYVG